ncbi:MAG: ATP-binding protein, partial [bacterium]
RAGFEVDGLVKEVSVDVQKDSGVLARTVREKKSYLEEKYAAPGNSSEREFFKALGLSSFAVVPLVARDRVVGAIMVDNLATREAITRDDLTFLMLFANQAASAIEMARAYKYLEMTNRELTDARDLLVRHKTLATLGEFSAGVAHELRNPLVSIGGFARRLIRSLPPDSDARNYARIISTEVEGLEQILSQILDFVAGVKPRKKKVDMNVLLEHVLQLFRKNIESAGIRVETELDEAARYLVVDEVQMRQLFINLVKNAVEAMPEGGKLNVRSACIGNEDAGVGFEVSDTGHGIAPEDMEKVFTPFFTRKDKGMGLGLSISSRIVEGNHGGRMFLDSKRGQGTSVLVWLPLSTLPENGE